MGLFISRRSFNRRSDLLILLLIVFSFANANPIEVSSSESAPEGKVELTLYYETLCPYCTNFIVNYLYQIFDNGLDAIVDLKLSPYGNAKIQSNGTIVCQHGPWECLLNTVEACAIHVWPAVKDHFPFIYCVEDFIYKGEYTKWDICFDKLDIDPNPVLDCYKSGYGNQLELQYAAEIKALEPPHTYVPWVVVDGQPLHDDYRDFMSFICKAYKGSNVPQACSELSHNFIRLPKHAAHIIKPVCYREEKTGTILSKISSVTASWIHQGGKASM